MRSCHDGDNESQSIVVYMIDNSGPTTQNGGRAKHAVARAIAWVKPSVAIRTYGLCVQHEQPTSPQSAPSSSTSASTRGARRIRRTKVFLPLVSAASHEPARSMFIEYNTEERREEKKKLYDYSSVPQTAAAHRHSRATSAAAHWIHICISPTHTHACFFRSFLG